MRWWHIASCPVVKFKKYIYLRIPVDLFSTLILFRASNSKTTRELFISYFINSGEAFNIIVCRLGEKQARISISRTYFKIKIRHLKTMCMKFDAHFCKFAMLTAICVYSYCFFFKYKNNPNSILNYFNVFKKKK